jgi:hypothetical protein
MEDWKSLAKLLPYGQSRKFLHCGSSPAARVSQNPSGLCLYCFRCGESLFEPHGERSPAEILAARVATDSLVRDREIPSRAIHLTDPLCPSEAILWTLKAGLTPEDASVMYNFRYDPDTRRVLIPLDGGFLARAVFGEKGQPKYILAGNVNEVYQLRRGTEFVVVVEDALSAIKVARAGFSAIALLGTSVSAYAASKIGEYKSALCWTDGDKAGDAAFVNLRKRLGLYETTITRIRTEQDPKLIQTSEIIQLIGENHEH